MQSLDKPKLVGYAMKGDLVSLARLAGLRAVRYLTSPLWPLKTTLSSYRKSLAVDRFGLI